MKKIIVAVRRELKKNADPKTKESGQRFFKEAVKLYGVKSAAVSRIGKVFFPEIKNLPKNEIWNLCEEFWQSGFMEESFVACQWSYSIRKLYEPSDFNIFEAWIGKYVNNWASCDTFCNHTVGALVEKYPQFLADLKRLAHSKNRWLRRAAAVSLIIPAKRGLFLKDIFAIADILLLDQEDLVQKGYGWMLKVASQPHQKEVFDYVMKNKKTMPRTALRYAIEKMPTPLKTQAMEK
jgi:3-methyladenine DNA glycosylase AlkD